MLRGDAVFLFHNGRIPSLVFLLFVVGGNDMKKKHLIKLGGVLALVVLLVYFSKPDRGGIRQGELQAK